MVFGVIVAAVGQPRPVFSMFYTPEGNDSQRSARQQAIIRRVADDHSFQLQCMREAARAAEDRGFSAKFTPPPSASQSGGPASSTSVSTHSLGLANSSTVAVSAPAVLGSRSLGELKGNKRSAWSSSNPETAAGPAVRESGVLEGILMLQVSCLFRSPKLVLWKRVDEMLYMVAFEVTENCLLVSNFLTFFVHILADVFGVHANSPPLADLLEKRPDALLVALHHLLPGGQLMFTNVARAHRIKADVKEALQQGGSTG
ncbi:hypothetical protein Esti_003377 [Eimeria stiedai]